MLRVCVTFLQWKHDNTIDFVVFVIVVVVIVVVVVVVVIVVEVHVTVNCIKILTVA
jgi:hypothetical protein